MKRFEISPKPGRLKRDCERAAQRLEQLRYTPRAHKAYEDYIREWRAQKRMEWMLGTLMIATTFLFAALPFILYWGDLLP